MKEIRETLIKINMNKLGIIKHEVGNGRFQITIDTKLIDKVSIYDIEVIEKIVDTKTGESWIKSLYKTPREDISMEDFFEN